MRAWIHLGMNAVLLNGCLITENPPDFPDDFAVGSCLCAVCRETAFCWEPSSGSFTEVPPDGVCDPILIGGIPVDTTLSVPASRIVAFGRIASRQNFFCFVPDDSSLNPNHNAIACPSDSTARAALESNDPCTDIPVECRDPGDPEFASCTNLGPAGAPGCPLGFQTGVRVSGCVETNAVAIGKIVEACNYGGLSEAPPPPGDRPRRFCFTSCLEETTPTCNESSFDPPEVTAGSYTWDLQNTGSTLSFTHDGSTAVLPINGLVSLNAPRCDPNETCTAELSWVRAEAVGAFTWDDVTYSEIVFQNPQPITGTISPIDPTKSMVEFAMGATMLATGEISEYDPPRRQLSFTASGPITGSVDWFARTVDLFGTFTDPTVGSTATLQLHGGFPNRAPQADAGPDQVVSCTSGAGGEWVTLNATASFDPDDTQAESDIDAYLWSSTEGPNQQMNLERDISVGGISPTVFVPVGSRVFSVAVRDKANSISSDTTIVSVVDTTPPTMVPGELPRCLPNDQQLYHFHTDMLRGLFTDSCHPDEPEIEITSISFSGLDEEPDPEFLEGPGGFCLRGQQVGSTPPNLFRTYTVDVTATDASGNQDSFSLEILVPSPDVENECDSWGYWDVHPAPSSDCKSL